MRAEIISIGDEILIGQTVNTNATFIGQRLTDIGIQVKWITSVGDNREDLLEAFKIASSRADVVIATGGLGPTHDDITKEVASQFFNSDLVLQQDVLERIKKTLKSRGLRISRLVERQALVPERAQIIENEVGTAPGFLFCEGRKYFFILPGVPAEMKSMMEREVIPFLKEKSRGHFIKQKTLRTTGITESSLFEKIGVRDIEKTVKVAFLPKPSGVDIRLTAQGVNERTCLQNLKEAEERIRERIGDYIYGYNEENLEEVVARLLLSRGMTVAVAESCTGGLLAHKLTDVPGSSRFFERGVVAYSDRAKVDVLGVPEETIRGQGAVSPEVALAMAQGVRRMSGADIGIATTGIAGPGGGTEERPVGLVYIGYVDSHRSLWERHIFKTDRVINKERAVQAALNLVRKVLKGVG